MSAPSTTTTTTTTRVVTAADLEQDGFGAEQIARLEGLRACYPYVEFTDSTAEFRRLSFLKWRRERGEMAD